jgi:integrase/recombinase XerC/integrase/recombinase XerD
MEDIMRKTAPRFKRPDDVIGIRDLSRYSQGWLLDSEIRQLSTRTLESRKFIVDKLLWFLRKSGFTECGIFEIRQFLAYISNGHESPEGRWDNPHCRTKVRPRTVETYFVNLRTLFRFLVEEEAIEESPLETMRPPIARRDQIQPFTRQQVEALLQAAKKSRHSLRDQAIVLLLLDSGVRASELCSLKTQDLDMQGRFCRVLGKGNKRRSLYFGRATTKAIWKYLREEPRDSLDPLFMSDRGTRAGEGLTRSGLQQIIERLGKAAEVKSARCSPHTFRHTFAIEFLRAGGNVFSLKEMLGHTSLTMVNRYVALAESDIENQHRQFSPADRLKGMVRFAS